MAYQVQTSHQVSRSWIFLYLFPLSCALMGGWLIVVLGTISPRRSCRTGIYPTDPRSSSLAMVSQVSRGDFETF